MKLIKKVSSTPVQENTGAIIDSLNTTDNPHTNAPSINAIKTYVDNEINDVNTDLAQCVVKGDVAIVTGTISLTNGSGMVALNYPDEFANNNCVPIATGVDLMASGYYSYVSASEMIIETRLASNNIQVLVDAIDNVGPSSTKNVKVVLMKVS